MCDTSSKISHKSDDIPIDKTHSLSVTSTYKIHPQKSDEEIEVYNIIMRHELHYELRVTLYF